MKVKKGTELNIKRLYLDGIVLYKPCPDCGTDIKIDMGEDYMSYPEVGTEEEVYYYCDECDTEASCKVILTIEVTEV